MADLLTAATFESRTGYTLDATEATRVDGLITDASNLVIDIVDDADTTDTWDDTTVPGSIVPVLVAMIRRELDNPHGYTSEQMSGYLYQGGKAEGIFATRPEVRVIRRAAGRSAVTAMDLGSHLVRTRLDVHVWQDDLDL